MKYDAEYIEINQESPLEPRVREALRHTARMTGIREPTDDDRSFESGLYPVNCVLGIIEQFEDGSMNMFIRYQLDYSQCAGVIIVRPEKE